jgi:hypothetical protein
MPNHLETWIQTMTNHPDTWVNPLLQTNCVAFNKDTKEFLLITNGICTLDHSTQAGYTKDHARCGCKFRPYEGIVLRIIGFERSRPIHGWMYVTILEGTRLEPAPDNKNWFMRAFQSRITQFSIGRL